MCTAVVPICMSKPHFNATLRDGQAVGFPVAAIPSDGATRCVILCIEDHPFRTVRQGIFFKTQTSVI